MEKVTRIPNLFGIDGYALPSEFQKEPEQERKEQEEDFGKILDFEIGRRKHNAKTGRARRDSVLHRREP